MTGDGRGTRQGEGEVPPPPADADLARLVAAWPTLPEPIKAAVRALLGSVATTPGGGS